MSDSEDSAALSALISQSIHERRFADAMRQLDQASALDVPLASLLRAQALWGCGSYDDAVAAFCVAAQQIPGPSAPVARAQALASLARVDEALDVLATAGQQWPDSVEIALLDALFRLDRESISDVLPRFRRLREMAPGVGEVQIGVMGLELLSGERAAIAMDIGRPRANARWQFLLHQKAHAPPARVVGTAAQVMEIALQAAADTGLTLEFGVFQGRSIRHLASRTRGQVHGFDSFEGLPEAWTPGDGAGAYTTRGVLPMVPDNVVLHAGWFDRTVSRFMKEQAEAVRFVHIDCDLFSSTVTVLEAIAEYLGPGSILVFDDYMGIPGEQQHEFEAFRQVAARHGWRHEYLAFSLLGREAALKLL